MRFALPSAVWAGVAAVLAFFPFFFAVPMLWADDTAIDQDTDKASVASFEKSIPDGELGDVIRLGRTLIEDTSTHPLTKGYVGNALDCTSCHLENGLDPKAASFVGVASAYPAWSPREKRVITLEDRILNCFMRSCNGTRPPLGSRPSVAIAAWITWLSKDTPIQMNAKRPAGPNAIKKLSVEASSADKQRGAILYANRCASCHAENGAGVDENPPVWGGKSYNQGAGFANNAQLAAWLKVAMPLDDATLTEQEAIDIAAYVNSHERPVFRLEDQLPKDDQLGEYNGEPESSADPKQRDGK
jgi:thiosulfate dehydrogenase